MRSVRVTLSLITVLALGMCVGCAWMLPAFHTRSRDVTNDRKYWGGFRPGEAYRVIADTPVGHESAAGVFFDERSPVVPAGTRLRIERFVRHTGYNAGMQVTAAYLDGRRPGGRQSGSIFTRSPTPRWARSGRTPKSSS